MIRVLKLLFFLSTLSFVSAQPPLTNFDRCQQEIEHNLLDLINDTINEINDTVAFCILQTYLDTPSNKKIDRVINFVHERGAKNLQAGYFSKAKEYRTIQANLARRIENDSIYMEALYQIALSSYRMGDVLDAARYNMEGKIIAIRDSFHMRHISFLYRESWIYWRMLRNEKAIESMEECKALAAKHSPNEGYLFSYHNGLGSFYRRMDQFELSRFHQDSAIFYAEKLCYVRAKAIARSNRAIAYAVGDTTDLDYRIKLSEQALQTSVMQVDREQIAANYSLLGTMSLLDEDYEKAIEMYDSTFYYTQITKDRIRELHSYRGWTEAYERLEDYEKALEFKDKQFELYKELYGASKMSDVFDLENVALEREADFRLEKIKFENDLQTLKLSREKNNILIILLAVLIASLVAIFWFYWKKQKQEIENLVLKQESQNRIIALEKKALRAQMNPHFIFNSLNSIKSYIAKNEARTATRFLNKFSQLMRIILANSGAQLVPINEELNSLRLYIELEQFRLNKSFEFEIVNRISQTESENLLMPPLIIQPYVENAIWHGLVPKEGYKKLDILVFILDNKLKLTIRDNGIGRDKSATIQGSKARIHKSMGIEITKERLNLHSTDSSDQPAEIIDLFDSEGFALGTEVQLSLPIKTRTNE